MLSYRDEEREFISRWNARPAFERRADTFERWVVRGYEDREWEFYVANPRYVDPQMPPEHIEEFPPGWYGIPVDAAGRATENYGGPMHGVMWRYEYVVFYNDLDWGGRLTRTPVRLVTKMVEVVVEESALEEV